MLITGLEGPITIASASRSAVQHLRRRLGLGDPLQLDPEHLGLAAVDDQVLLQVARARPRSAPWSAPARRTSAAPAPRPRGRGRSAPGRRSGGRPRRGTGAGRGRRRGRGRRGRTSSGAPSLRQALEDGEGVVADPPAALRVDFAAEPVGDEVGVGGDVDAERLDVVAGVGDHREVGADLLLHPGAEFGAAGAAGEEGDPHRPPRPSGRRRAGR